VNHKIAAPHGVDRERDRRSAGLLPRVRILDRLKDLEALELGMAEIERLVGAGVPMGRAKMFGLRPGGEGVFVRPDRVRRIEHVIVALRPAQKMEFEEPALPHYGDATGIAFFSGPTRWRTLTLRIEALTGLSP